MYMKNQHPTERELEFFVNFPDSLTRDARKNIRAHLKECRVCREEVMSLRSFRSELKRRMNAPLSSQEEVFADAVLNQKREIFLPFFGVVKKEKEKIEFPQWREIQPYYKTTAQKIILYARRYPVRATGFASIVVAALFTLVTLVQPKIDSNPVYAKLTNYVLRVYNKEGVQLWTQSMLGYADDSSFTPTPYNQTLLVADIDGEGKNEVLIAAGESTRAAWDDTLKCFNYRGTLRWKRTAGTPVLFGERHSSINMFWQYRSIFTFSDSSSPKPRLFATAGSSYLPSKLFEIDPRTGKDLQAYWVPGAINTALAMDIDHDGKKELLIGGCNDAWNRASLAILDPSDINGHAPVQGDYTPQNCPPAHEKYYLLFPYTEYGQLLSPMVPTNYLTKLYAQNNGAFTAVVEEVVNDTSDSKFQGTIHYSISPAESPVGVMNIHLLFDNPFIKGHEVLEREGKLKDKIGIEYAEKLIHEILFWDGEKFVNTPTFNKKYTARQPLP
jgi:hypothetical protein